MSDMSSWFEEREKRAAARAAAQLTAAQTEAARAQALAAEQEASVLRGRRDNEARQAAILEAQLVKVREVQAEEAALAARVNRLLESLVPDLTPVLPVSVDWVDHAVAPLGYAAAVLSTAALLGWLGSAFEARPAEMHVILMLFGAGALLFAGRMAAKVTVEERPFAAAAARAARHKARVRRFVAARIRSNRVDWAPQGLSPSGLPKLNLHVTEADLFEDLHAQLEHMSVHLVEAEQFNAEFAAWCARGEPEVAEPLQPLRGREAPKALKDTASPPERARGFSPGGRSRRR